MNSIPHYPESTPTHATGSTPGSTYLSAPQVGDRAMFASSMIRRRRVLLLAPLLCLSVATPVFAALGGGVTSPAADGIRMKAAAAASTSGQGYTMESMVTDDGTTVREYVSPDGKVFLVTWDGPRMPDLQQVFGDYYQQYLDHLNFDEGHG